MPVCAEVNQSMQKIAKTIKISGEQNQEIGPSRSSRDWKDTKLVFEFLKEHNPFDYDSSLCDIANGVHGNSLVNVQEAKAIGECILEKMVDVKLSEFSFKRKDQAVTLGSKNAIKVNGENIQVDPQLLFKRMTVLAKTDLGKALCYELCTIPKSLFETTELPHAAPKASLADSIWKNITQKACWVPEKVRYVLDGGLLRHCIPWTPPLLLS